MLSTYKFSLCTYDWLIFFSGKILVDPTPELQKELKQELDKVAKQYGGEGADMTKFPELKFPDPVIDPINSAEAK